MIKFLKNNYNFEELLELRKIARLSFFKIKDDAYCESDVAPLSKTTCDTCKYKNSCRDMYNMYMYISHLIKTERNK